MTNNTTSSPHLSTKKVAIVILNWNGAKLMEEFLPSVIAYSPAERTEVVVADNGSTDNSIALLQEKFPSVRIIQLDKNYGFAEGYNQALKQLDNEYTVLLNSDVEVTPDWLDAPLAALEADATIAAAQPKIRAQRNKEYFEYAGAAGGYMDIYGYPYCRGRMLHVVEKDEAQYDTPADILWATGACLFIRTAVYKEIGGLDAGFFAHQEEIDMCWRLRSRGYRLVCTPESVVYHVGGATLQVESPRKTFLNFRNNLLMLYKNLPEKDLKPVMRARFWLDYIAATKFLLCGHIQNAKAVYEARKAFFDMKPEYEEKRRENLAKTTLPIIPELMCSSLILAFYLKGKKKYSDL
ncbi:glycosyltransferase family 2 protein [Parabacteroides goldsteinii]|uniref:glycosyltransferase family 2 protein n=1 Tax=Parabacteroides goldsteinii TaxID=328812 RepID=UPI00241F564F|nr:glycosyltransferase family 2 protein [Parabacteroides goldsteinii]